MNIGLVTSYMIGGILMLAILGMNMNLSRSSGELTISHTTGRHVNTISEILSYDVPKIGYDKKGKISGAITHADSNAITFYANIDDSAGVEEVRWEFTTTPVGRSENPNDYVLMRRIKHKTTGVTVDKTDITLGVTKFHIRYFSDYGMTPANRMSTPITGSDLDKIRQIEIVLVCESPQKMNGMWSIEGDYIKSAWEKRFSPRNLQNL